MSVMSMGPGRSLWDQSWAGTSAPWLSHCPWGAAGDPDGARPGPFLLPATSPVTPAPRASCAHPRPSPARGPGRHRDCSARRPLRQASSLVLPGPCLFFSEFADRSHSCRWLSTPQLRAAFRTLNLITQHAGRGCHYCHHRTGDGKDAQGGRAACHAVFRDALAVCAHRALLAPSRPSILPERRGSPRAYVPGPGPSGLCVRWRHLGVRGASGDAA